MARPGVSYEDIAAAADALLDAGERPTAERIRLQLGRGSPNTIGPLLDRWWATLGARLRQQQAKVALPDAPIEVAALASQLWEQALAMAREHAQAGLATEHAQVAAARDALAAERTQLQAEFDARAAAAEAARHAQGVAEARLADAQGLIAQQTVQLDDLRQQRDAMLTRVERLEAETTTVRDRFANQEAAAAQDRVAHAEHVRAVEDRAHAEVDRARAETKALRYELETERKARQRVETTSAQQARTDAAAVAEATRIATVATAKAEALGEQLRQLVRTPPVAPNVGRTRKRKQTVSR